MTHLIIVGFGPVSSFKYSQFIIQAMRDNRLSGFSIIDVDEQREEVCNRIGSLTAAPADILFLPNNSIDDQECKRLVSSFLMSKMQDQELRVLISTEPQAHEFYINLCLELGIKTLTTKPFLLPFAPDGFAPEEVLSRTQHIAKKIGSRDGHAIICSGKFHEIFEDNIRRPAADLMQEYSAPITSIHMKTNSGVWNLNSEFSSREDHPYKYGYGMLYHGAYHYISILADLLDMNATLFNERELELSIMGFAAFPDSQNIRIPSTATDLLKSAKEDTDPAIDQYGETDSVFSFRLSNKNDGTIVTLGTLSLEQTGPGFRAWSDFPDMPYNKNGRLHDTELDIKLGTLASFRGHITKVPVGARTSSTDVRTKNFGTIISRKNAEILGCDDFYQERRIERPFGSSFSFTAEKSIFDNWLSDMETRSEIRDHILATKILHSLGMIVYRKKNFYAFDL